MAILINNNYAPPIDNHDGGVVNVIVGEVAQAQAQAQAQGWPEDLRFSQKTFHAKVDNVRLTKLYYMLLKLKLVADTTMPKNIIELFSGDISEAVIRWIAPQDALNYFIKEIQRLEYIEEEAEPWIIVRNRFRNKDGEFYNANVRKGERPKKYGNQVDLAVSLLNPTATTWDRMTEEEFIDKIDEYNDTGIRIKNRLH